MMRFRNQLIALMAGMAIALTFSTTTKTTERGARGTGAIVIGHRGASGYIPEHTLAAYYVAIQQGADFIEPDLVITQDGVLVARHENEIGGTTDVAQRPEFASRRTTRTLDGAAITGWFTDDFTLAELKTLRAKERIPATRPANTRFDGMFEVPTFEEILALVTSVNENRRELAQAQGGGSVKLLGVYPETKHPTYFQQLGLPLEAPLVTLLNRYGYNSARDPVFIQSFETANLKKLASMTKLPLVQLVDASGKPYDFVVANDPRTYADLIKPAGLQEVAGYAQALGANKNLIIPRVENFLGSPTTLVRDAHQVGLLVHGWTFRAENAFLPMELRSSTDPTALGDLAGEVKKFLEVGLDGFFTDHQDIGVRARDDLLGRYG